MKKLILSILTVIAIGFGANAQNVNIPDANFKAYLVGNTAVNTNADTEIQVSEATAFTGTIDCSNLSISDLTGIEAFTVLTNLTCHSNSLSLLDVSNNTALTYLNCAINLLSSLDLSNNTALTGLYCQNNSISTLDLSNNTAVYSIYCPDNLLISLNVANGNNTNTSNAFFTANNNPSLTCIQVDDVAYSTTNWTNIDAGASFSLNCGPCVVTIPDANFKAYLVGNTAINTNGDTEIQCSEASAFNSTMICSNLSITDLTGIEAFTSLNKLDCQSNQLTSLNVNSNTVLTELYCQSNQLTSLIVNTSTNLNYIYCTGNNLTSIDISNLSLGRLFINYNSLTSIDVSSSSSLAELNCTNNQLSSLDISPNTTLTYLQCQDNQLTSLNAANGNNANMNSNSFNASNNSNLICIEVDNVSYSTTTWTVANGNIDATANFSTSCSLGVDEISNTSLSIYPNPAASQITISNIQSSISNVTIIDITGKTVITIVPTANTIDVSNLIKGIYFLQVQTSTGITTSKFIKE